MRFRDEFFFTFFAIVMFCSAQLRAQGPGQLTDGSPATTQVQSGEAAEGVESGGYRVQQSIELGYRITDTFGSVPMYDTLVNLQQGPRVLEQSLSMQSTTHEGFFDTLTANSFGWGGDPSNAIRLRVAKYRLYNFTASFRRDQNYFDYDLFANPLNPPTGTPTVNVNNSPHAYYNGRHMYDFGLTLFPQHRFSVTLGYNRNRMEGPSYSSVHEGTEALLYQPINNSYDQFRFGLSWRANKHTMVNFTETIQRNRGDTNYFLSPFNSYSLSNGSPVSLGLSWFNGGSPCAAPIIGGFANPSCNGYLSYSRAQRVRTTVPTEQLTFQSSSINKLDLTGTFSYSNANMSTPVNELFNGLITRTGERVINTNGTRSRADWISVVADAGATYHLMDKVRVVDNFRFRNFRVPGIVNLLQLSLFNDATVAPPGSLLFPPAVPPSALPNHGASSAPADVVNESYNRFVGQDMKQNEVQLQIDTAQYFGFDVGYRYTHTFDHNYWTSIANNNIFYPPLPNRGDCAGLPLNPDGSCTFTGLFDSETDATTINEHTALAGVWLRPRPNFRINGDVEFGYADAFLTRIDPRHVQRYRAQASYTPRGWLNLGANLNIIENRNHTGDINYGMHSRNFGFNALVAPKERFSFEAAYNYSAFLQNSNVCYVASAAAPGSFPCVNGAGLLEVLANYNSHTHFGETNIMFKPVKRAALRLGYSITDVSGSTLILNALQPLGPLNSRFQAPLASVDVEIYKGLSWRGGWNYYQYGEGSFTGPTSPRYFHANIGTIAFRYSF